MPCRDVVAWTTMLVATIQAGLVSHASQIFHKLPQFDVISSTAMLQSLAKDPSMQRHAKELFDSMPERNAFSWNAMLQACVLHGGSDQTRDFFHQMPQRDAVSWNLLVAAAAQAGMSDEMTTTFERMPQYDISTWNQLLGCFSDLGELEQAETIFFTRAPQRNALSWMSMIHAYNRKNLPDRANSTFHRMPAWNDFAWVAIIQANAAKGDLPQAQTLFHTMPAKNLFAWSAMVQAAASSSSDHSQRLARRYFDRMPQRDVVSWVAMAASSARLGNLESALEIVEQIPDKNIISWTAIIQALIRSGYHAQALDLFLAMQQLGIHPNEVTFLAVLTGCSHAGLVDRARDLVLSMGQSYGMWPSMDLYLCMVDVLARAERLELAEELIRTMPYFPDDVAWTSLLSACNSNGDRAGGARAAREIVRMVAGDGTPYVLLSNTHAQSDGNGALDFSSFDL
ncbi:pentatricopeptide repeat-containing protein At4g02750-like [Selaginella moellendorffii]|uniref:pentatricopeptide repeat-containing protein At4g02750-like n=1 Tax=Selaginella moellendorffii TaxID=88036 RepID=UPI000D1C7E17|nr:pentatricopeptide repeat-containing protein At4g02750-like [Selaginella moellendorffii]|eukprot:XP_024531301.1 pentatricopeptide repeat-containing protein At4g02750-like [Selaginella moellendorffii]